MIRKIVLALVGLIIMVGAVGCQREADVVSHNLSQEADRFNILRRIVFYNGITDTYMLTIEGYCSLGNYDENGELTVTCKTGVNDQYKKHFLGLSDNVTYFVEQLDAAGVSADHYKVIFRPTTIVPDIEFD